MNDTDIGLIIAVLGSFSFGAYILPRKLSRLSVLDYQYWLSLVVAPLCIIATFLFRSPLLFRSDLMLWSFLCGPLWTLGSLCYSSAVDNIGVARSTPVKNLAPVFASAYGIALFHEYTLSNPTSLAMTVGGVLLMCAAAFLIGRVSAMKHERALAFDINRSTEEKKDSFRRGMLYAFGAAFFYGAYSVPLKYVFKHGINAYSACAWLGVGVLASTLAIYIFKEKRLLPKRTTRREIMIAQTAGGIWTAGQILGAVAMLYIPMSISWPVSNLSTLVAIGWGVWVFKEVHIEEHWGDMLIGVMLYVAGLALLAFAAPSGHL